MTGAITDGDRFARARAEFVEAMAAGCTIPELRRRKVELRQRAQREVSRHTADLMDGDDHAQGDFLAWGAQHMMRD